MDAIERRLIKLITLLSILFIFDYSRIAQSEVTSPLTPLIFPVAVGACLIPITLRLDWNFSYRIFGALIAFSSLAVGGMDPTRQPALSQQNLSYTLIQTLLIVGIAYLSQKIAMELRALFMGPGHDLASTRLSEVKTLAESQSEIHREISRARRYKRPLGLMAFEPVGTQDEFFESYLAPIHPILFRGFIIKNMADHLQSESRHSDLVMEDPATRRIVCLCWDADRQVVEQAVKRLSSLVSNHMNLPIHGGYAVFPDDAVTFDQLIASAYRHLEDSRIPSPSPAMATRQLIGGDHFE